jgi:hypothetical protein
VIQVRMSDEVTSVLQLNRDCVTYVRYENMYAALRIEVLYSGGNVTFGNISSPLVSNKVASAPRPEPECQQ